MVVGPVGSGKVIFGNVLIVHDLNLSALFQWAPLSVKHTTLGGF